MAKELQVNVRADADDMRALKRVAVGLDRSVSWCIRTAINEFVKRNRAAAAKGSARPAARRKSAEVVTLPANLPPSITEPQPSRDPQPAGKITDLPITDRID